MDVWTEERVENLKELWAKGFSGALIAQQFGMTRNMVIGKAHRLGLSRRRARRTYPSQTVRGLFPRKGRQEKPRAFPVLEVLPPLPETDTPKGPLVMFADLDAHHCRASYGDPQKAGFGFCGCPIVPGTSYCEDHVRRYHQITQPHARRMSGPCVNRILTKFPAVTTSEREDVLA